MRRTRVCVYIKYKDKDRTKDWLRKHSVCELERSYYTIHTLLTETAKARCPKQTAMIPFFSTTINQLQTKKRKKEVWDFEEEWE